LAKKYIQLASEHPTNGDTYNLTVGSKKAAGAVTLYSSPNYEHLDGLLKIKFR
jgi:hypothetical protein